MKNDPIQSTLKLEAFLPYRLVKIADAVSVRFSEKYRKKYGLGRPEWRVLATLGEHYELTATLISQHSTMHKTKVSRAVHSLELRGWLKRRPDNLDRRIEHLSLTRPGRTTYQSLAKLALEFQRQISEALGERDMRRIEKSLDSLETLISTKADD